MQVEKVLPEDLQRKFRSKEDLYDLLFIDLRYHLPPFENCPMHFLRKVLNGEKKMIKKGKIIEIVVPRFKELSVNYIWPLVKEVNDLLEYFLDYKPKQYPDRSFMYSILATLRFDQVKSMVENARKNRALENKRDEDELVYINKELLKEIESVFSQKLTKGKATHLLKRSAELGADRKLSKEYKVMFTDFKRKIEESKEEDDMN